MILRLKKRLGKLYSYISMFPILVLFVFPASTNYELKGFEFGGGGDATMQSATYGQEAVIGEIAGAQSSATFQANSGLVFVQQSNVPPAPTFENTNNTWYNKLKFIINTSIALDQTNGTKFAIAISDSSDGYATTRYIQDDNTVGTVLGIEDYQTYAQWGGSSGEYVIGLNPGLTYKIKVKSFQGKFTESGYSQESSATTQNVTLSFDIDVGTTSTVETGAPYSVDLGDLNQGSVTTASDKVWIDLETNAENGGYTYIYDQYGGLRSTATNYTITSVNGDLTAENEGFGVRGNTASQSSGGPLTIESPYNGSGDIVGVLDTTIRKLFNTSNLPIVSARGSFEVKAKISNLTPASSDYSDLMTVIAAASF